MPKRNSDQLGDRNDAGGRKTRNSPKSNSKSNSTSTSNLSPPKAKRAPTEATNSIPHSIKSSQIAANLAAKVTAAPSQLVYFPSSPFYTPTSPAYSPESPAYNPKSPSHWPISPIDRIASPVYRALSPTYQPTSPPAGYAADWDGPTSPAYFTGRLDGPTSPARYHIVPKDPTLAKISLRNTSTRSLKHEMKGGPEHREPPTGKGIKKAASSTKRKAATEKATEYDGSAIGTDPFASRISGLPELVKDPQPYAAPLDFLTPFPWYLPTNHNAISNFDPNMIARDALETVILMHPRVPNLITAFLKLKRAHGSEIEEKTY